MNVIKKIKYQLELYRWLVFLSLIVAFIAYQITSAWSYIPYVVPIISVFVGTALTLIVTRCQKKVDNENNMRHLVAVISSELRVLQEVILDRKKQIESLNEPIVLLYITEDYFTVFSKNADKLGLLPSDVSDKIIHTYIEVKGLFDTVRSVTYLNKKVLERNRDLLQWESPMFLEQVKNELAFAEQNKTMIISKVDSTVCLINDILKVLRVS